MPSYNTGQVKLSALSGYVGEVSVSASYSEDPRLIPAVFSLIFAFSRSTNTEICLVVSWV